MQELRGIDHLVWPVFDLDAARERFSHLGFTVAPNAEHPFGTGNACIFFEDRTYLEPLAVVDEWAAHAAAADEMVFVSRAGDFWIACWEGLAMIAVRSDDAEATLLALEADGCALPPVFSFSRQATRPDGTPFDIGVKLAFAKSPENEPPADLVTFFGCQRIHTEGLFAPERLDHANGATGIKGVVLSAENPSDHQYLLESITGQRELRATSFGIEAVAGGSHYAILTPAALNALYGVTASETEPLRIRAVRLACADLNATESWLTDKGIAFDKHGASLIVSGDAVPGSALVFEGA